MNTLTAARNQFYNYCEDLPSGFPKQATIAFATAFIVRSVVRNDLKAGLLAGALSVTATGIHALIPPLFMYFTNRQELSWEQEMARGSLALIGTAGIASALGDKTVVAALFLNTVVYGVRVALDGASKNINQVNSIVVFPLYTPSV